MLRELRLTYHVQICLRDNSFQFLALFAINNTIHNHVNRAGHIFLKQFVENFLFLEAPHPPKENEQQKKTQNVEIAEISNYKYTYQCVKVSLIHCQLC